MIAETVKILGALSLALLTLAAEKAEWKIASKTEPGIEFQWSQPAGNSCQVTFRDLRLKSKTSLIATIQYLPHRAAKRTFETHRANLVIGGPGQDREHISSCEEVVSVVVSGVNRQ